MIKEFTPHEIVWTNDKSSRFWDYFARNKTYEDNFFSKQVGDAIIDIILRYDDLSGDVLDYGCGHGFLIEKLLRRNIRCEGLDFSPDSVDMVEKKFHKEKNFKGVSLAQSLPTSLESNKFGVVFFIETIEHILTEDLGATLKELYRIIRRGGYVLVTTCNEEYLEANKIICPECGCIFHRVQHISSWSKNTLSSIMKEHGFTEVICKPTILREGGIIGWLQNIVMIVASKILKRKNPHLIYIGRKCIS